MNAFDHVRFCKDVAKRVCKEFETKGIEFQPEFACYFLNGEKVYAYMHPEDKYKNYEELVYPFGDI